MGAEILFSVQQDIAGVKVQSHTYVDNLGDLGTIIYLKSFKQW